MKKYVFVLLLGSLFQAPFASAEPRTDFRGAMPSSDEIRSAFLKDHKGRKTGGKVLLRGLSLDDSSENEVHEYNQQLAQAVLQSAAPSQNAHGGAPVNDEVRQPREVRVSFDMVKFDFNSTRLTSQGFLLLKRIATVLLSEEFMSNSFVIEGHTDAKGGFEYNENLSLKRALAVRNALVSMGVDSRKLLVRGRGESMLLNSSDPYSGENRRVEFVKF